MLYYLLKRIIVRFDLSNNIDILKLRSIWKVTWLPVKLNLTDLLLAKYDCLKLLSIWKVKLLPVKLDLKDLLCAKYDFWNSCTIVNLKSCFIACNIVFERFAQCKIWSFKTLVNMMKKLRYFILRWESKYLLCAKQEILKLWSIWKVGLLPVAANIQDKTALCLGFSHLEGKTNSSKTFNKL